MSEEKSNRLFAEKSPYLLQHAHNPVDWYPWGDEAFKAAEEIDRPIFLSIGHSTCHWCHVMERESFMDGTLAGLMNEAFINVKVDREERPDIDRVYMTVSQMMTGGGGWPLTIIMTPEKMPFFASTYIPKHSRSGRTGMLDLINRIETMWENERNEIIDISKRVISSLKEDYQKKADACEILGEKTLRFGYLQLSQAFDELCLGKAVRGNRLEN